MREVIIPETHSKAIAHSSGELFQELSVSAADDLESDLSIAEVEPVPIQTEKLALRKVIMCVDDNYVNLSSMKIQLETMGYKGDIHLFQATYTAMEFVFENIQKPNI